MIRYCLIDDYYVVGIKKESLDDPRLSSQIEKLGMTIRDMYWKDCDEERNEGVRLIEITEDSGIPMDKV